MEPRTFSHQSTTALTRTLSLISDEIVWEQHVALPPIGEEIEGEEGLDEVRQEKEQAQRRAEGHEKRVPRKCNCRYLWNTELHGLTALLKSRGDAERLLWLSIIGVCVLLSIWTTDWMLDEYLERQTATLFTVEQRQRAEGQSGLKLPVIVVCPKNPDSLRYPLILRDISKRLPRLDRAAIFRLLSYAVAGAGFRNVAQFHGSRNMPYGKQSNGSEQEARRLAALFKRWLGRRTLDQFYRQLFEQYGYRCEDFLQKCFYGAERIPCCDIFVPYYVVLRGRCMRLNRTISQMDPDMYGRLDLYINQMPSRLTEASGWQPQVVVYLTDEARAVGIFPRFYVHFRSAIVLRARARQITLLPGNEQCQNDPENEGRSSCWLRRWLKEKLIGPYNCTVFYLGRNKYGHYPVCDPMVITRNYRTVINPRLDNDTAKRCLPACNRYSHIFQEFRPKAFTFGRLQRNIPDFRFEVSFTNLEVYQEVLTTTLPGFISQLGGQSGLFVGLSLCTIVQMLLSAMSRCYRHANALLEDNKRRREQNSGATLPERP